MAVRAKGRFRSRVVINRSSRAITRERKAEIRDLSQRAYLRMSLKVEPGRPKHRLRQSIWEHRAANKIIKGQMLSSSFITYLEYDGMKKEVSVRFKSGSGRIYSNVPRSVFDNWYAGRASCKTTDSKHKYRLQFWVGKTPSLGAFYNQNIKGKYVSRMF